MNIRINQNGYNIQIDEHFNPLGSPAPGTITIHCNETGTGRIYDMPGVPYMVDVEETHGMHYIFIYMDVDADENPENFLQLKLESPHEIVLDHFEKDGEIIEEMGCWDFYDDPQD